MNEEMVLQMDNPLRQAVGEYTASLWADTDGHDPEVCKTHGHVVLDVGFDADMSRVRICGPGGYWPMDGVGMVELTRQMAERMVDLSCFNEGVKTFVVGEKMVVWGPLHKLPEAR